MTKDEAGFSNKTIVGYDLRVTGGMGYDFYDGNESVVSAGGVFSNNAPVYISGENISWVSRCESSQSPVYGVMRYVEDCDTGTIVGSIKYRGSGKYVLNHSVTVHCGGGTYSFYWNDEKIAEIRRCGKDEYPVPEQLRSYSCCVSYFKVDVFRKMNLRQLALICSFPMLQFTQ